MTWTAANVSTNCLNNAAPSCQPSVLTFMAFLVQHFSHSNDEYFTASNPSKQQANDVSKNEYDFIIVGAGSAGCVLANRLSEIEEWKVLLLEAGDEEPLVANVPAFSKFLRGSSADWQYKTQPQSNACLSLQGKSCSYPSGKVMGGSSTINSMYYSRGNKYDYDSWAKLGNLGWSYDEVLEYFKKSEDNRDAHIVTNDPNLHATGGYLTVQRFPYVDKNMQTLIDAWKELDYKQINYNSVDQIGFNRAQFTIVHGARQSTNGAFLRPIRGRRSNLFIRPNSPVTKIIIDAVTKEAIGVEYSSFDKKNIIKQVFAKKEVIIAAGALNSPKLLMLSGIGKTEELAKVGIETLKDLPVGDNFQDHVNMHPFTVIFQKNTSTIVNISDVQNDVAYWMSTHEGPLASLGSPSDLTGYIQTPFEKNPGVPDINVVGLSNIIEDVTEIPENFSSVPYPRSYYNTMDIKLKLLNIKSKGNIRLNKKDPTWGAPLIQPNFFSNPEDLKTIIQGAFMMKKFVNSQVLKTSGIMQYKKPKAACKHLKFESSAYFECVAVNYTEAGYHGVGSCKMGPAHDSTAVVDPRLLVYGIKNLRVIDASVMPTVPRGNTNAPTIMIAEKGSDMIKEDWLSKFS